MRFYEHRGCFRFVCVAVAADSENQIHRKTLFLVYFKLVDSIEYSIFSKMLFTKYVLKF